MALAVLIISRVGIRCCQVWNTEWCWALACQHEKPSGPLKGRSSCCCSERKSGLKNPGEKLGQEDGGNLMKKGLLQDRTKRAARTCQWTFPAVLEITCAA